MKIEVIKVSDLEPFMKFKKLEGILNERLMSIKRMSERKLELLKDLQNVATRMNAIKRTHNFSCDKEMMKEIRKYSKY